MKICCFTGHRRIPPADLSRVRGRLAEEIEKLAGEGVCVFRAGGALGFDTLAAEAVLAAKKARPQLRLVLMLPCRDQTRGWPVADVQRYQALLERADEAVYTAEQYDSGCMYRRNRALVKGSDCCLCYLTSLTGGTRHTVELCRKSGVPVRNLADMA